MGDRIELLGVVKPYKSKDDKIIKYGLVQVKHLALAGSAEKRINDILN